MNDNLNTPIALSHLFDGIRLINAVKDGKEEISEAEKEELITLYNRIVIEVLGLKPEKEESRENAGLTKQLIDLLLQYRIEAKEKKDFAAADNIRRQLTDLGIIVHDTKNGFEWEMKE